MRTKTTLLAIFVIVTAIALVTAGSITASTLAVKKKSATTSTGSKKTKSSKTSTGGSATTAAGTGNSTLGGTDKFSKFSICMRLETAMLKRLISTHVLCLLIYLDNEFVALCEHTHFTFFCSHHERLFI